jgi:cyclase
MSRVRVIPVLLLADGGMVKTTQFAKPRYLGDPINAVKIYNEKMVDELVILDIEATRRGRIDFDWIEDIVSEAFMPVAYGGGIRTTEQCQELFRRGVEKVVVNTAVSESPALISEAAGRFGSQSVVVSIDARKNLWGKPRAYVNGGRQDTGTSPVEWSRKACALGAGEIILTSIAHEGTFKGYDLDLLRAVSDAVDVPVVANGGAGSLDHFVHAVVDGGCSAVAAGSMFVFAGKGEGVLITYPTERELEEQLWRRVKR